VEYDVISDAEHTAFQHELDRDTGIELIRNNILKEALANEWEDSQINDAVATTASGYRLSLVETVKLISDIRVRLSEYTLREIELQMFQQQIDPTYEIFYDEDGDLAIRIK